MISTEAEFLQFLDQNAIHYKYISHPPVYTCEQAEKVWPSGVAVSTKNLFLTNKKQDSFYLVMLACAKKIDTRQLGQQLGAAKLHFGPADKLMEFLGVTPGAVTVLGLVNDRLRQVKLYIDFEIWGEEYFLCHPLVNTSTLVLAKTDLELFFKICGHPVNLIKVPGMKDEG